VGTGDKGLAVSSVGSASCGGNEQIHQALGGAKCGASAASQILDGELLMGAKERIENLLEQYTEFRNTAREFGAVELAKNWNVSINTLKMVLRILKDEEEQKNDS
jgi:hypothetical protein